MTVPLRLTDLIIFIRTDSCAAATLYTGNPNPVNQLLELIITVARTRSYMDSGSLIAFATSEWPVIASYSLLWVLIII